MAPILKMILIVTTISALIMSIPACPLPESAKVLFQIGKQTKEEQEQQRESIFDFYNEARLFELLTNGTNVGGDDDEKCSWLRSQIIGGSAEFESPFGRRLITYSDHTASGRFLGVVEEYLAEHVLPFYGNTHTVDSYVGLRTSKTVQEACHYIKHCLGCGPQDALLFCGFGATAAIKRLQEVMGLSVPSVLRSKLLEIQPDSDRWVIFTGPYEHHSNLLSWRQSLAEVVEIGLDDSGEINVESLVTALESPEYRGRPKLGSFSACSNVAGIYTDTRALARVLHQHGAFACFDFASSGPYEKIDMKSGELDGYDAVFISPHKFIGGPGSPGILVMSEALYTLKGAPPSTSGGGTVSFVNGYDDKDTLYYVGVEEREDAGTPGIVQKIRAALAFSIKEYMGYPLISMRERVLIERALDRLLTNPSIRVLGNTRAKRQPIISFLVYPKAAREKHLHCHYVTKLLNDLFGIQARGGCACAAPYGHVLLNIDIAHSLAIRTAVEKGYSGLKPGWTRISFSYYSSVEEMEFVVDAIEFIAMYGHRFLPLYHFDWRTGEWRFDPTRVNNMKGLRVLFENQHSRPDREGDDGEKYTEYMNVAKRFAHALPDSPEERLLPGYIDPQLVTFRV